MEDGKILDLFFARDDRALDEAQKKYGAYCLSVARGILSCEQDAEEAVNDTWLRAWNSIPPQRPTFLRLFLAKITRNLAFTRWRDASAAKRGGGEVTLALEELADCIPGGEGADARLNARELARTIRSFLDTIGQREQDIFLRRYFYVEPTAEIARRYDMKPDNVLRILSRTRMKLKDYLLKEGYDL